MNLHTHTHTHTHTHNSLTSATTFNPLLLTFSGRYLAAMIATCRTLAVTCIYVARKNQCTYRAKIYVCIFAHMCICTHRWYVT
jgi:hypothetical protein